ncbi:hypothetical protein [Amycolatopsis samaneae]|uniref:Uncharacterized protein n=1 Tax=Amycolatopsis samaneae TaxID=664691 RepID=A0ABW5GN92_9PSEU
MSPLHLAFGEVIRISPSGISRPRMARDPWETKFSHRQVPGSAPAGGAGQSRKSNAGTGFGVPAGGVGFRVSAAAVSPAAASVNNVMAFSLLWRAPHRIG